MVNLRVCLLLCIPLLCASAVLGKVTVGCGNTARLLLKVEEEPAEHCQYLEMTQP